MEQTAAQVVTAAESRIAAADHAGWLNLLHDEVRWTVTGTTTWSRTFVGKEEVRAELTRPLAAQFSTPYRRELQQLVADGDWVAARCQGRVQTRDGVPYDNQYSFWFHVRDGRIDEIIEYGDTALIDRVLMPSPGADPGR